MTDFNPNDVIEVAKALSEFGVWREVDDNRSPCEWYECQCCDGNRALKQENFKHELNCPILVAQDILTGHKNK